MDKRRAPIWNYFTIASNDAQAKSTVSGCQQVIKRDQVSTMEPEVLIESPPVSFWDEPGDSSNSIENTVNPADEELSRSGLPKN